MLLPRSEARNSLATMRQEFRHHPMHTSSSWNMRCFLILFSYYEDEGTKMFNVRGSSQWNISLFRITICTKALHKERQRKPGTRNDLQTLQIVSCLWFVILSRPSRPSVRVIGMTKHDDDASIIPSSSPPHDTIVLLVSDENPCNKSET